MGLMWRGSRHCGARGRRRLRLQAMNWLVAAEAGSCPSHSPPAAAQPALLFVPNHRPTSPPLLPWLPARLHELFCDYASFGASKQRLAELDSARFMKLCRECGLLCKRFTPAHADITFTSAKSRREQRRCVACCR